MITLKQLKNSKFRRTEEAIIMAFFASRNRFSAGRIAKIARISRSTLYRHHKNIYEVAPDYERFLLKQYTSSIRPLARSRTISLTGIYCGTFTFLRDYRKIITFVMRYGDATFIEKLLTKLATTVVKAGKLPDGIISQIYVKEVAGLVENWIKSGFKKDEIIKTINKITYLTNTAASRLAFIAGDQTR